MSMVNGLNQELSNINTVPSYDNEPTGIRRILSVLAITSAALLAASGCSSSERELPQAAKRLEKSTVPAPDSHDTQVAAEDLPTIATPTDAPAAVTDTPTVKLSAAQKPRRPNHAIQKVQPIVQEQPPAIPTQPQAMDYDTGHGTPPNDTPVDILSDGSITPTWSQELADRNAAQIGEAGRMLSSYKDTLERGGTIDSWTVVYGWGLKFACPDKELSLGNAIHVTTGGVSFIGNLERETTFDPVDNKWSYTGKYIPRIAGNGAPCSITETQPANPSALRAATGGFVEFTDIHVSREGEWAAGDAYIIGRAAISHSGNYDILSAS